MLMVVMVMPMPMTKMTRTSPWFRLRRRCNSRSATSPRGGRAWRAERQTKLFCSLHPPVGGASASCDVHSCALHSAHTDLTINMPLYSKTNTKNKKNKNHHS
jgi:hypothetical protein